MTENPFDQAIRELRTIGDNARAMADRAHALATALTNGTALPPTSVAPYTGTGGPGPQIADDADLDRQWGNPTVRKSPPRWSGQDYTGATYSDCPPEFLDSLAGFLEWQAGKADEKNEMANNGKPRSGYLRKDAARARGWSRRNAAKATAGRRPAPRPAGSMGDPGDDEVPF